MKSRKYDCWIYPTTSPEQFAKCVVTNTTDCIELITALTLINEPYYPIGKHAIDPRTLPVLQLLDLPLRKILDQDYTLELEPGKILVVFKNPYKCPYSERTHSRQSAFINKWTDGYYFKCAANSCKQGTFGFPTEVKLIDREDDAPGTH